MTLKSFRPPATRSFRNVTWADRSFIWAGELWRKPSRQARSMRICRAAHLAVDFLVTAEDGHIAKLRPLIHAFKREVRRDDLAAAIQRIFDNVAADISGGAGNQNRFHGSFLLRFTRAVGPQFIQALQPQVVQQQCAGLLFMVLGFVPKIQRRGRVTGQHTAREKCASRGGAAHRGLWHLPAGASKR